MIAFDLPWHGRSMPPRGWRGTVYENDITWYMGIIRAFIATLGSTRSRSWWAARWAARSR